MLNYNVHFLVALATVFAVVFICKKFKHLVALFCAPILYYCLFYNFDNTLLGGVFPIVTLYVGAIYTCALSLFLASVEKNNATVKKRSKTFAYVEFSLFFVLIFLCLIFVFAIPWGIDTFPLSNVEAVLFTLFAGENSGAEEFVISSFLSKVLKPAIIIFSVVCCALPLISYACNKFCVNISFKFFKSKFILNAYSGYAFQLQKLFVMWLVAYCVTLSATLPGIIFSAPFKALFQQPVNSSLYAKHYVDPDSVKIEAKAPKNLIVIFMESMETNFAKYTPEIVNLEQINKSSFEPGGVSVSGTSWTIAGITGKLCGIPLNMPMGINEYLGKLPTYLPHAKCLMNILNEKGYVQVYAQGTSGDFTQKRTFWTLHGNVLVHDIEYYKKVGMIPNDYYVFWGFEDYKLYEFAKTELNNLYATGKPFALYMLTVDTHQPNGYLDSSCAKIFKDVNGEFPKVLHCASKMLNDFIEWAKNEPWYKNTAIVIMGDHTMQMLSAKANVPLNDSLYFTNFILSSAQNTETRIREYTSFDMFPTILEAMNFNVQGRALGLGKSLYSNQPTVIEIYGRKTLDSLLRERSYQYDYFLFGK